MLEDRLLVYRFNRGDGDAFRRIYLKYRSELMKVAGALIHDRAAVEDVLHEVFVGFARQAGSFRLQSSLKAYLAICVANRARYVNRREAKRSGPDLDSIVEPGLEMEHPLFARERAELIGNAVSALRFEQREILVLRLQQGLRFKVIAERQGLSINTVMSRYRYALDKLHTRLNGENTVYYEDAVTQGISHWFGPHLFSLLRKTENLEVISRRKRVILGGSLVNVNDPSSWEFEVDRETELPLSMKN